MGNEWSAHLRCNEAIRIDRAVGVGDEFIAHTSFAVDAARLPVFAATPIEKLSSQTFKEIIFRACGQAIPKAICSCGSKARRRKSQHPRDQRTAELHVASDSRAPGLTGCPQGSKADHECDGKPRREGAGPVLSRWINWIGKMSCRAGVNASPCIR